jgi:glycosyltransferase involved in cell wall biosynthesis
MNFTISHFNTGVKVPNDCQIVFVSDMFVKDYVGGAELTTQALIDSSPYKVFCVKASAVTQQTLQSGHNKVWIFGNYAHLNPNLIPIITNNFRYYVLEYDYKYCKYRSPEKHKAAENTDCDCHLNQNGNLIFEFYAKAIAVFWMSIAQLKAYTSKNSSVSKFNNVILSSVFDDEFFSKIEELNAKYANHERDGYIVLGSQSWVKGYENALSWCQNNSLKHEIVWNLPYDQLLEKLAKSKGFVYLPNGADTCPRMVIEAKLLGCELYINEHVQHANEDWFKTDSVMTTLNYLKGSRQRFWNEISKSFKVATISGYTTTYNCVSQGYPFEQSIASLLSVCDEVCVVDGGSTDGTWEILLRLAAECVAKDGDAKEPRLKIKKVLRDWNHPRFARFDGEQKAEARRMCTKEFCWQMDSDEIIDESDSQKIRNIINNFPTQADLFALPVIEFWGCDEKIRCDVNPWKWRLSRNLPHITHGIPANLRRFDENGELYAMQGTDGCDYVDAITNEPIQFVSFYTQEVHNNRLIALSGNPMALSWYQQWFNALIAQLPSVWHYSWYDMGRKIRTYKNYWSKHWNSLYNQSIADTQDNNMFFDKSWKDVTESEIDALAERLTKEMGGWIFHTRVNFSHKTPWINVMKQRPASMWNWKKS